MSVISLITERFQLSALIRPRLLYGLFFLAKKKQNKPDYHLHIKPVKFLLVYAIFRNVFLQTANNSFQVYLPRILFSCKRKSGKKKSLKFHSKNFCWLIIKTCQIQNQKISSCVFLQPQNFSSNRDLPPRISLK